MVNTKNHVSLIGVPTDVGAGSRGAGMAPEALRVAGLVSALERLDIKVSDGGNLSGPLNPWASPVDGFRHLSQVIQWNHLVFDAVYRHLNEGRIPLMMGGDHSMAIGSISAVARYCREQAKDLLVVWLDAHADFNTAALTPSGNIHGMPVACLCGHGPQALISLSGQVPALRANQIRQVGVRSVDEGEKRFIHQAGIEVFDMRYIDESGMSDTLHKILRDVSPQTHLHVSFDVDFLDPDIAPGVATAVRGGPSYREAQLCMEILADTGVVGSIDVVELNPALDVRNQTARLAVDLIESLFGKSTLVRKR
ncbi:arginase [Pollutimonas bauzanensis]|uniref:arginase n=1 Tax=Pollutimonas bauzanensis TaxID=658167 RepID=UPI003342C246